MTTRRSRPPAAARPWVDRPRLTGLLEQAFAVRLTTLFAGAGYGKSALLDEWSRRVKAARHVVPPWQSGHEMMRAIVAALAEVVDVPEELVRRIDAPRGPAGSDVETAYASALSEVLIDAPPTLLILDDCHESGKDAGRLVEAIIRHAPPSLHLVLGARTDPPYPLDRLRGRGEMLEIDATALAFTEDEVLALAARYPGPRHPSGLARSGA